MIYFTCVKKSYSCINSIKKRGFLKFRVYLTILVVGNDNQFEIVKNKTWRLKDLLGNKKSTGRE